jgi:hypothetical protein
MNMDAAIRKAKDSINQMLDKNVRDLIRGIRNHPEDEVQQWQAEIAPS